MILWRISNYADLLGIGGLHTSARWHTQGRPIVYLTESPSCALLETLVHFEIDREDLPNAFQLLKIEAPDDIRFRKVMPEGLPGKWKTLSLPTRRIGDEWLQSNETALLAVPSALTPETWNWLLNPRHPDASRIRILAAQRHAYDRRLFNG